MVQVAAELCRIARKTENNDLLVEILGTLGNLTVNEVALRRAALPIAWALSVPRLLRRSVALAWARAHRAVRQVNFMQLLVDYEMLAFVQKHLVPGFAEDDIVLEVTATRSITIAFAPPAAEPPLPPHARAIHAAAKGPAQAAESAAGGDLCGHLRQRREVRAGPGELADNPLAVTPIGPSAQWSPAGLTLPRGAL